MSSVFQTNTCNIQPQQKPKQQTFDDAGRPCRTLPPDEAREKQSRFLQAFDGESSPSGSEQDKENASKKSLFSLAKHSSITHSEATCVSLPVMSDDVLPEEQAEDQIMPQKNSPLQPHTPLQPHAQPYTQKPTQTTKKTTSSFGKQKEPVSLATAVPVMQTSLLPNNNDLTTKGRQSPRVSGVVLPRPFERQPLEVVTKHAKQTAPRKAALAQEKPAATASAKTQKPSYSNEQKSSPYVPPVAPQPIFDHLPAATPTAASSSSQKVLIQLIKTIVSTIHEAITPERRDLVVEIKNVPHFEGVSIQITEMNAARGEYNLTFFNLTNSIARSLVEAKIHQQILREALMEKGYALHMITIEPKLEYATSHIDVADLQSEQHDDSGYSDASTSQEF